MSLYHQCAVADYDEHVEDGEAWGGGGIGWAQDSSVSAPKIVSMCRAVPLTLFLRQSFNTWFVFQINRLVDRLNRRKMRINAIDVAGVRSRYFAALIGLLLRNCRYVREYVAGNESTADYSHMCLGRLGG